MQKIHRGEEGSIQLPGQPTSYMQSRNNGCPEKNNTRRFASSRTDDGRNCGLKRLGVLIIFALILVFKSP